ncbi:MAG: hypothetical protein N4A53_06135 [Pelagimonas sp.]|jgi:hypothetical protein|nr:hypothetical protein [Pelagimonas sp.]
MIRRSSSPARALRRWISKHPTLYLPIRKARKPHTVVTVDTRLLIEGFPRCANTWTEALVRHAAPGDIALAHHSHAAAHVKQALRLGVPAMVLYRDPDDAVRSYLTYSGNQIDARAAYLEFVTFYRTALPLTGPGLVWFSFEDVTRRPRDVIAALNARFDLGLSVDGLDAPDARDRVMRAVSDTSRPDITGAAKQAAEARAAAAVQAPEAQAARAKAQAIYQRLTSSLEQS